MGYGGVMYIMQMQKQQERGMTSIRVSDKLRTRLARIRARLTLRSGNEVSMEELIEMLADAYEEKEAGKK
jgi:hypothetical protein